MPTGRRRGQEGCEGSQQQRGGAQGKHAAQWRNHQCGSHRKRTCASHAPPHSSPVGVSNSARRGCSRSTSLYPAAPHAACPAITQLPPAASTPHTCDAGTRQVVRAMGIAPDARAGLRTPPLNPPRALPRCGTAPVPVVRSAPSGWAPREPFVNSPFPSGGLLRRPKHRHSTHRVVGRRGEGQIRPRGVVHPRQSHLHPAAQREPHGMHKLVRCWRGELPVPQAPEGAPAAARGARRASRPRLRPSAPAVEQSSARARLSVTRVVRHTSSSTVRSRQRTPRLRGRLSLMRLVRHTSASPGGVHTRPSRDASGCTRAACKHLGGRG